MLRDTAHIQEKDAEFLNKRAGAAQGEGRPREHGPVEPLYTMEDAERTLPLFQPVPYHTPHDLDRHLSYECYDAGHILGSSCVVLHHRNRAARACAWRFRATWAGPTCPSSAIPRRLPPADYLILESTYGGRLHKSVDARGQQAGRRGEPDRAAAAAASSCRRSPWAARSNWCCCCTSWPTRSGFRNIPIFVDSPLAVNVTAGSSATIRSASTTETRAVPDATARIPFGFSRLQYIREASESKKLNDLHGPFVVISASGMCEQGRILHHLRNNIEDPRNTVLITGFQAQDTLGRKLVEKWPEVRIFGEPMRVRAEISSLDELSGHADQGELLEWMKPLAPSLRKVFLVHGEPAQSETFAQLLTVHVSAWRWSCPAPGECFELA